MPFRHSNSKQQKNAHEIILQIYIGSDMLYNYRQ